MRLGESRIVDTNMEFDSLHSSLHALLCSVLKLTLGNSWHPSILWIKNYVRKIEENSPRLSFIEHVNSGKCSLSQRKKML